MFSTLPEKLWNTTVYTLIIIYVLGIELKYHVGETDELNIR